MKADTELVERTICALNRSLCELADGGGAIDAEAHLGVPESSSERLGDQIVKRNGARLESGGIEVG